MKRIFQLIYPAPVQFRLSSKESFTYFYQAVKFIGWKPPREGVQRCLYLVWSTLVGTFSLLYIPIGMALSLVANFATLNLNDFLSVIELTVNTTGTMLTSMLLLFNFSRMNQIDYVLDRMDDRVPLENDRRRIHKAVADANYIFLVYAILYGTYATFVFMTGILNARPPWMLYNPFFDWRNGLIHLLLHSLLEHLLFFLIVLSL